MGCAFVYFDSGDEPFSRSGGEFTPLSKPLKKKEQAEKARLKYPERKRGTIGVGVIRGKS